MVAIAVIEMALFGQPSRPKALYINGLDILRSPGVPIETIEVNEAGSGGVSSMVFEVDDPTAALTFSQGDEVRYEDNLTNRPIFRGWVTTPTVRSDFGGQGRRITVQCTGVEAILDWSIVPAMTFPGGPTAGDYIQALCAVATWGAPGIRPFKNGVFTAGDQAGPISNMTGPMPAFSTPAGTLRNALLALCEVARTVIAGGSSNEIHFTITVDFWLGLRAWESLGIFGVPADYVIMFVTVPESAEHTIDGGSVIHGVVVTGGNAAGSGFVGDGTGAPGAITPLADPTILTGDVRDARAWAILGGAAAELSGTVDQLDFSPTTDVRVGSPLALTSPNTGAAGSYTIMGISKTFNPSGRENWSVTYGALPMSSAQLLRRLTRSTLS